MEEVLHGDPTPPGSRQLYPTGLVSNLNKRDTELTSDQDGFHIKTEVFSDSDSEMDSLEMSEEKNEHFSSNNGRQKNTVEGTNQGETTPSHLDLQESNVHGEENDIFNSENNAAKHNMKIPNTSKVNNTCDLEVSNSQKEQRLKMCSPAQNKKHTQTFQMKPEMRLLHGRNRQMNGTGVQSKTMRTTTFYHTLRRQARKNLMSRWLNLNVANNRQRLITKNSNRIQQVEPKDSDFAHSMNQNNFEQLYNSGENGAESFERLPVSKDSPKNSPDEQNTFVSIANKLTDMLEKLVESERQHLLVRQKEADVELQRQRNERERISNEKLRITMEETQRREDREHHYKVMQLILGRTVGDGISSVLTDKKTWNIYRTLLQRDAADIGENSGRWYIFSSYLQFMSDDITTES